MESETQREPSVQRERRDMNMDPRLRDLKPLPKEQRLHADVWHPLPLLVFKARGNGYKAFITDS